MGKTALTFAEIFIVLSLVFLIQTIANFNLYEGIAEQPPAEWIVLSLRQVPSAGSKADHLKYLKLSGGGWERGIQFFTVRQRFAALPFFRRQNRPPDVPELTRYVDADGQCRERIAPDPRSFGYWCLKPEREGCTPLYRKSFLSLVETNLGVSLSRIEVSGSQPEYVLSWKPGAIPADTVLTLGIQHCTIPQGDEKKNLEIDPKWGIGQASLEYPHPLIISRTEYRNRIVEVPQQVQYVHQDTLLDSSSPLGLGRFAGLVLRRSFQGCELEAAARDDIRGYGYREIALPLKGS